MAIEVDNIKMIIPGEALGLLLVKREIDNRLLLHLTGTDSRSIIALHNICE